MTATKTKTKTIPAKLQSVEQRAVVEKAIVLKEELRVDTDTQFARQYLGGMHPGTWTRLRDNEYGGNLARQIAKLEQANNRMEVMVRGDAGGRAAAAGLGEAYHMFPLFKAIDAAVQQAMREPGQERLVVAALPTGGGKTATSLDLHKRYGGVLIHARPSYRRSGLPLLKDILRALGKTPPSSVAACEELLLIEMNKVDGLLVIDEGNTLGSACQDYLKMILNQTRWTVVFFATPAHLEHMVTWYAHHADQLFRRRVAILRAIPMAPEEVDVFLGDLPLNGSRKDACQVIAEAATLFGRYALVGHVARALQARRSEVDLQVVRETVRDQQNRIPRDIREKLTGKR